MGLFGSVKNFFGGHGIKANFTRIEQQDPAVDVQFCVTDSCIKANFDIVASSDAKLLSTSLRFICEKTFSDGKKKRMVLCEEAHHDGTFADEVPFPHGLKAGETLTESWVLTGFDVPKKLKTMGYSDLPKAIRAKELKFYLEGVADIEGSPFDPWCKKTLKMTL